MTDRPWFPLSAGLLTPAHCQQIGAGLWVFLWLIHHEHRPEEGEPDGLVNAGRPVTHQQIADDLGLSRVTVRRQLEALEAENYIRSERVGGDGGKLYYIAKPFRWTLGNGRERPIKNEQSPEQGDRSKMIAETDQKRSQRPIKNDRSNKETKNYKEHKEPKPLSEPSSDEENKTNPPARRKNQKPKPPSADGMALANELLAEILANKPDFHLTDDRLANWARSADLMIASDKRSPPHVSALIRWVQHDSFWKSNVLSMDKLREKFDQLEMKMQQTAKGGNFNGKQLSSDEYLKQALAAAARMRGTVQ